MIDSWNRAHRPGAARPDPAPAVTAAEAPAALLRRAAALMRERANAATLGPWKSYLEGRDHWGGDSFIMTAGDGEDLYVHVQVSSTYNPKFGEDQDHIAAWSPPVALAVADWLEATARDADEFVKMDNPECAHDDGPHDCDVSPAFGCDRCGEYLAPGACSCWDKALAVARAYLGGTDA